MVNKDVSEETAACIFHIVAFQNTLIFFLLLWCKRANHNFRLAMVTSLLETIYNKTCTVSNKTLALQTVRHVTNTTCTGKTEHINGFLKKVPRAHGGAFG
jgi:hypothetical protein